MTVLLDSNVLIALMVDDHVHHHAAEAWLAATTEAFATCPITEGSLVRMVVRKSGSATAAIAALVAVGGDPRHEFWPDSISYRSVPMTGVIGHRQVTDAYLVQLTRERKGRLATFDQGLAKLHTDVVELIATR